MPVLIGVEELAEALSGGAPPVLADVRWSLTGPPGRGEFQSGHLPGAQWVDLEQELSAPPVGPGGRHPLPAVAVFQAAMRRIGVGAATPVVVCDAADALAASRLWWLLDDAGHPGVRVLDGGVAAWRASGRPLVAGPSAAVPVGDFVARPGHRSVVDAGEVAAALSRPEPVVVVDVRAAPRYSGATEPMDPVAGHIPGAVNLPSMANVSASGTFRPAAEIAARYAGAGIDEDAVVYCGSGITAAHTLLALQVAGAPRPRLYPGSWSDWVSDPSRPVATGEAP